MPIVPENAVYECFSCHAMFINVPINGRGAWNDKLWGPWTDASCKVCRNPGLLILGKLPLKRLAKAETPARIKKIGESR